MLQKIMLPSVLLLLGLLTGCDAPEEESAGLSENDRKALESRVEARWQARIAHDWGKAWEYSSPAYREVFPKRLYVKKFSYTADWELTGIEVTHYDPLAAVASVAVGVMSRPTKQTTAAAKAIGPMQRSIGEKWLLIDGEWWYGSGR